MQVMYPRCAGLDLHKKTVVACRVLTQTDGRTQQQTETFGTSTKEVLRLRDWLAAWEITHVAMESTGEYWKPVYNLLEGAVEILLVNARHVKAVPGRKTDVRDAEWLADLLRHGLLRASFVPPRGQRELRDLTRQRSTLVRERASVVNRLQKVLEDANVKLASVATDITGVSGRAMLRAKAEGVEDIEQLAGMARGRMRSKQAALSEALEGRMRDHHRFLVRGHLGHLEFLEQQIALFDTRIEAHIAAAGVVTSGPGEARAESGGVAPVEDHGEGGGPVAYAQAVELLDTIPGIDHRLAEVIVAEIGTDMSRFPSAQHLASWAGVAPGNNESAGKQRSGKTPPGNRALRKGLVQGAHAASHTKNTYLSAQYHRLAVRRGRKKAIVAVAHSMLVMIYHILSRQEPYRDLGSGYFDERERESVTNRLVRRLQTLGFHVALAPMASTEPVGD
jgi:transposase